jgi:6-pyruvoyltetrahydropterin/6-carboxytetrahydropterin synthase
MDKIRITKEFNFEMAHALWNYDGLCSNIHGHSYKLFVTLIGTINNNIESPKNGMVVDFGDIKKWVKTSLVDEFDHALLVNEKADFQSIEATMQMFNRLKIMSFQPTCENLLVYIANKIMAQLPEHLKLFSLKLQETTTSYAEWYASDNE